MRPSVFESRTTPQTHQGVQKPSKIVVIDNFRIRHFDPKNWVLEQLTPGGFNNRTKVYGPDKWVIYGYYGKLSDLVIALLNLSLEVDDSPLEQQLQELLHSIYTTEQRLTGLLEGVQ